MLNILSLRILDLNGVCTNSGSLGSCTNQCGGTGGSFKVTQNGSGYKFELFAASDCALMASLTETFTCLADEAPASLNLGTIKVTCQDPSSDSASPPVSTTAALFVVAFAATFALLL
ncbi:hypothetical protein ACTFIY_007694 [Dictyostelium cf. discoideum]